MPSISINDVIIVPIPFANWLHHDDWLVLYTNVAKFPLVIAAVLFDRSNQSVIPSSFALA